MSVLMIVSSVLITLALFFYSLGVWSERIVRDLRTWHVIVFWIGLLFDISGTWAMHLMSTHPFDLSDPHSITGQIALWLMFIHVLWATWVVRNGSKQARSGFNKYSICVWLIWLVPYFGGVYIGMVK